MISISENKEKSIYCNPFGKKILLVETYNPLQGLHDISGHFQDKILKSQEKHRNSVTVYNKTNS